MEISESNSSKERHSLPEFKEKLPGNVKTSGRIGIKISYECAATREGQLLLWMTCNLAARLKGLVTKIELVIPNNVKLSNPQFIPFANSDDHDLKKTIVKCTKICARECEIITSLNSDFENDNDAVILLGQNTKTKTKNKFSIRAIGCGWLAFVGNSDWHPKASAKNSNNPFGSFCAACIVVGDIFKFLGGMITQNGSFVSRLCFSSYDLSLYNIEDDQQLELSNPDMPENFDLEKVYVVGSGAVGNAVCHSLYSMYDVKGELVIIDRKINELGESETIEDTNLNRYIMAVPSDCGKLKGSFLTHKMNSKKSNLLATGFDDSFETYVNTKTEKYEHILSCVDTNSGRHTIQDQLPRIIHGGSTESMRIQISLYDLTKDVQCLKCYNPIQVNSETDDEIIKRLKGLSGEERKKECIKIGIAPEKLDKFLDDPQCGVLENDSIQKFAKIKSRVEASVGFVSAMSGIILAAELIKFKLKLYGLHPSINGEPYSDFIFNFWYDTGSLRPTKPNENCWCNSGKTTPRHIHASIWK